MGSHASKESGKEVAPSVRVFLMRHGRGHHQDRLDKHGKQYQPPNPCLTELGRAQAKAWQPFIDAFGIDVVLVSPLMRALETACIAFHEQDCPMKLCACAREIPHQHETIGAHNHLRAGSTPLVQDALKKYGKESTKGIEEVEKAEVPHVDREESSAQLRDAIEELAEANAKTIAIVCHGVLINKLVGKWPGNCGIIMCDFNRTTKEFTIVKEYAHPSGERFFEVHEEMLIREDDNDDRNDYTDQDARVFRFGDCVKAKQDGEAGWWMCEGEDFAVCAVPTCYHYQNGDVGTYLGKSPIPGPKKHEPRALVLFGTTVVHPRFCKLVPVTSAAPRNQGLPSSASSSVASGSTPGGLVAATCDAGH